MQKIWLELQGLANEFLPEGLQVMLDCCFEMPWFICQVLCMCVSYYKQKRAINISWKHDSNLMVNLSAIPATLYMFYYVSVDLDTCYMLDPLRQSLFMLLTSMY